MLTKVLELLLVADISFFVCFGVFNKQIPKVACALGMLVYLTLKIIRDKKSFFRNLFEKTVLDKGIFFFLTASLLSVLMSRNFDHAQEVYIQRYIFYLLFFYLAAFLGKNRIYFRIILISFLSGIFLTSIGGLLDISKIPDFHQLFTSFGIRTFFAAYFLYAVPFLLVFSMFHRDLKVRILAVITGIPVYMALYFHFARNSWIAFSIAVFATFFIAMRRRWTAILILLLMVSVIFAFPKSRARLFSHATVTPTLWGDRTIMWKAATNIFKQYPLFGAGPGNYELLMYKVVPAKEYKEGGLYHHAHAHNMYLELLAEIGVVGLISFLAIFFLYFKTVVPNIRNKAGPMTVSFLVIVLSVLIGELTASTIMVGVYPPALFWTIMGLWAGGEGT